jgi:hypothetical protein
MAWVSRELMGLLGLNSQGDLGALTVYTSATGKLVIFPRAPPLNPPSIEQIYQRQQFVAAARAWRELSAEQRSNWERAAKRASLKITGINLFYFWSTKRDEPTIRTIEQQTGIQLL